MIPSSLTRPSLMDALLIHSDRDEIQGFSSGPWLVKLMEEIKNPDPPRKYVFDDSYEKYFLYPQSSDKSRMYSLSKGGASLAAAGAADTHRVRRSSIAPAIEVVKLMPLVNIDREQSRESLCRESSLVAASVPAAVILPQEKGPVSTDATATAVTDEEQASRKRKVTSKKPVKRRKRALKDSLPQRGPSPKVDLYVPEEDIRDDDILGGRGGRSNNHEGNKRFRKIVADMKGTYRETGVKTDKTALSRAVVEYVHTKGGRFLIKNTDGPAGWRFMTKAETQRKTSQALRENKELKWTI